MQQIPTVAQLDAARRAGWHQQAEQGNGGQAEAGPLKDEQAAGYADAPAAEVEQPTEGDAATDETDDAMQAAGDDGAPDSEERTEEPETGEETVPAEVERSVAVQTLEQARAMLDRFGLLLFQPHPAMSRVPAPSFAEATLGRAHAAPTVAERATARSLMARLIAEGSAVPLNLLGAPGTTAEAPDFLASTAAFAYVFTLRGDKNWKQMPDPAGSNKVSPLAMNTYGLLMENGPQDAATLVGELGKGLTEAAVLRGLGELWQQLRVIPVVQANGKPTVWEPIASRLIKQVKAGANAGLPTALSALISLYLAQSLLATEDEIETFLSPLAPRSRIRDVVHALVAAQQLETITIEGRHHLHIPGELPAFAGAEEPAAQEAGRRVPRLIGEGSRIRKMARGAEPELGRAKPFRAERGGAARGGAERPARRNFGRPAERAGEGRPPRFERAGRESYGAAEERRPFRPREDRPASSREDRPFRPQQDRPDRGAAERPARFDRPWEEGKRPAGERRPGRDFAAGGAERGPARREGFRPGGGAERGGDRPAFGRKPFARKPFGAGAGERSGGFRPRGEGEERGEFRPRSPRPAFPRAGERGDERPGRPVPPRREFNGGDRPPRPAREDRGEGGFVPRGPRGGDAGERGPRPPFRRFDAPREGGRPFRPRPQGDGGERPRRSFGGDREGRAGGAERPFRPSKPGAREGRPERAGFSGGGQDRRPAGRSFGARPAGPKGGGSRPEGAGGSRPFRAKEGAGSGRGEPAGAGPFDKFKGGNKPWGKRPPARKIRREEDPS